MPRERCVPNTCQVSSALNLVFNRTVLPTEWKHYPKQEKADCKEFNGMIYGVS